MVDPITLSIYWLAKVFAAHSATAAPTAAVHTAAVHTAAVHTAALHTAIPRTFTAPHTAALHAMALHTRAASILATPIPATTVAGVTFVNIYNEMTKDAYKIIKAQFKRSWLSRDEKLAILDSAYKATSRRLRERGIFISMVTMEEANRLYSQEQCFLAA
jgi:hypothetical protein